MEILTPFTGEMLVLALLVVLNGRIFFTRRTRQDALAILAPLSVLIIFLQMMAWGVRLTGLVILVIALIAAILNYRSMVRFSQGLYVDSYSLKFFIASLLLLLVVVFVLVADILMRPVHLQTYLYNVKVGREYYSCEIPEALPDGVFLGKEYYKVKKSTKITDKRNLTLYTFSNKDESVQKDTAVIFIPDVQAETLNYEPYLILLARAGYTVFAADLYDEKLSKVEDLTKTKSLRRFLMLANSIKNDLSKESAMKQRAKDYAQYYEATCGALVKIADEVHNKKSIFVVSDGSASLALEKHLYTIFLGCFGFDNPSSMPGWLNLASIKEYTTPGFGFVAQTNPIFAKLFLNVERDKTSFAPSYCVFQTTQKIQDYERVKPKSLALLTGDEK